MSKITIILRDEIFRTLEQMNIIIHTFSLFRSLRKTIPGIFYLSALLVFLTSTPGISDEVQNLEQLDKGKKLFASGNLDAAYDIFFKLFKKDPGNEEINFQLGLTAFAKGDYESSLLYIKRALTLSPQNVEYQKKLKLINEYIKQRI